MSKRTSDRLSKSGSRSSPTYSEYEKVANTAAKRKSRQPNEDEPSSKSMRYDLDEFEGETLQDCIGRFLTRTSTGPMDVCSVCHNTWFVHAVSKVSESVRQKDDENHKSISGYRSVDDKEWICSTCSAHICDGKVAKFLYIKEQPRLSRNST